ncbi:MAG: hydantoinase B/oxoprolinase family protein [Thermomicrobiales bacterium]
MPAEEYRFDSPKTPPTHPAGAPTPPPTAASSEPMDPVQLEVLWNRLLSVANEQQAALMRTAFSTIVRESQDLACAVFDSRGQMMAQSITGTPGHINPLATGVHHLLAAYPPETLGPGDVLITNDPWMTSGQLNDFTVLTPIFRNGKIVAYFGNLCHAADIGGQVFSGEAKEIFEEGLRVPVTKLFDKGEPNAELLKIVRANVRLPDETVGDLYAQASCNDVGGRALLTMMDEFGLDSVDPLADEIITRSERALRDAIRTLANGVYTNEVWSDGFDDQPIKIVVTVTVRDDEVDIDFTGSSPQAQRGINVVLNYTHGYASFAIKAAIAPDVPHNDGAFRPVHVSAPEGSILNCTDPAPVAARHLVGHFVPSAIFGALAQALPGKLLAGGADPIWLSVWRGTRPNSDENYMTAIFQVGGSGARAAKDGLTTTGFPSGVAGVPAEVIESLSGLVQSRRELRVDSGGAGNTRGGLGQATEFWNRGEGQWSVSAMIDRTNYAAQGFAGGGPGALGEFSVDGRRLRPKTVEFMEPGQTVLLAPPGGAGYGSPFDRDPAAVLSDVVNGYVSFEGAARDYGVAVQYLGTPDQIVRLPKDYAVDAAETAKLRG